MSCCPLHCDESRCQRWRPLGHLESLACLLIWPYCLSLRWFSFLTCGPWIPLWLSLVTLRYIGLSCLFFKFLLPTPYFLSFIIVWKNVLGYSLAVFGDGQQNVRNLWDSLLFTFLFVVQVPMCRIAQYGSPSAEASACPRPQAWRWTVMFSMIFQAMHYWWVSEMSLFNFDIMVEKHYFLKNNYCSQIWISNL